LSREGSSLPSQEFTIWKHHVTGSCSSGTSWTNCLSVWTLEVLQGELASYEGHNVWVNHAAEYGLGGSDKLSLLRVVIYDCYVRMYYVHGTHGAFFQSKEQLADF
jgi:hypothetical protein